MRLDERRGVFDELADLDALGGALFGAGETQKTLGDVLATLDFTLNGRQTQLHALRGIGVTGTDFVQLLAEQVSVAGNDGERVVDFVDDARGQHAGRDGAIARGDAW